ncbi:MAG: hypothetical protein CBC35_04425 [Planctomycetes bacterium TMED75]|nr:BtpA family membrane complex biogenesis protein [Planctomycetaceae bacterium]OUU94219.1 MAG: hypothetical protein CBC35_04425 [Planctomycetes bacterium TMED75]
MSQSAQSPTPEQRTRELFGRHRALVGMVHVGALPGTPRNRCGIDELLVNAARDASLLADAGFDALLIENMHDLPYLKRTVGPEIVASMSVIARALRETVELPLGVQILAGANREALAVAQSADCRFIRAEGFAYASIADEGLLEEADAGPLLRYRKAIDAEEIAILADVRKKHSAHALTADVSLEEQVETIEFMGGDGVIVTGPATGRRVDTDEVVRAGTASGLPVITGSGACAETIAQLLDHADAAIIGSATKVDGRWEQPVDLARAQAIVGAARVRHA